MNEHPNNAGVREELAEDPQTRENREVQEIMDALPSASTSERRGRKRGIAGQPTSLFNDGPSQKGREEGAQVRAGVRSRQQAQLQVETHTVYAVFGRTDGTSETWLFVKSGRNHIQYLERQQDKRFFVTKLNTNDAPFEGMRNKIVDSYELEFTVGTGRHGKTVTSDPFDESTWRTLEERCMEWVPEDDDSE